MIRKLEIANIPLPTMYVVDNEADALQCRNHGIPYIIWHDGYELLVKLVMYPTLKKMFPGINWHKFLKLPSYHEVPTVSRPVFKTYDGEGVAHFAEKDYDLDKDFVANWQADALEQVKDLKDRTKFSNDTGEHVQNDRVFRESSFTVEEEPLSIALGNFAEFVNIKELQQMNLMPKWLGEINDLISRNLEDVYWQEGWNKKLGFPAGNYVSTDHAPNLIIVDVSASIPEGVASTMLSLIETLREQANADVIITGKTSGWYPKDKPMPSPYKLRKLHKRGNEGAMFNAILNEHVLGREWGNVIAFGDNDNPEYFFDVHKFGYMTNGYSTKIHAIWSYHTRHYEDGEQPIVGYARWAKHVSPNAVVTHNSSWVDVMN